jgi:hypothetical protein
MRDGIVSLAIALFLAVTSAGGGAHAGVLYSQLDSPSGYGEPDQKFEAAYSAYDSEGADDFLVNSGPWTIGGVLTPGIGGASIHVSITFYPSVDGEPGDIPIAGCVYLGITDYTDANGDLSINLEPECVLPDGHYWMAQQVRQDFQTDGQHYWENRQFVIGAPAHWRNPADGWGTGCTDWSPSVVCGIENYEDDFLFALMDDPFDRPATTATPAVGPFGMLLTVLALGGSSFYVLARRRRSSG